MKERFSHLTRTELLIMVMALLYILSPVDMVPELIAGPLGLTDDLAAAMVIGTTLLRSRNPAVIVSDPVAGPAQR